MAIIIGITALAVIFVVGVGFALASGTWSKGKKTTMRTSFGPGASASHREHRVAGIH
jgi:hypothetical protein